MVVKDKKHKNDNYSLIIKHMVTKKTFRGFLTV